MESKYQHGSNKIDMNGVVVWEKKLHVLSGPHVLQTTLNLLTSRRCQDENGKEMYQNVKRTCWACRAIVFFSLNPLFCGVPVAVISSRIKAYLFAILT